MDADLARALVALPGWRWVPGMRTRDGIRVVSTHAGEPTFWGYGSGEHAGTWSGSHADTNADWWRRQVPDLDDPATSGALLAMVPADTTADRDSVRERGDPERQWRVLVWDYPGAPTPYRAICYGPTLGHACALALLACWGPA